MIDFPQNLLSKLETRRLNQSFRELPKNNNLIDFSSNDYLGYAKSEIIFDQTHQYLVDNNIKINGATGSRLISGNHDLYAETENFIAEFHQSQTAIIFNSGYDANIGFFGSVPQRNDIILYDELCHASIRDGITMSNAKSYKFNHNDFADLENLIVKLSTKKEQFTTHNSQPIIYIVTESVFSMDGDCPNLNEFVRISEKYNCLLIIDEAHALGVFGKNGQGLVQEYGLQNKVFARIMTFGKGLGCHGAAILGSNNLKDFLVNFARSFIYTTGLSPHSVAAILIAYQHLSKDKTEIEKLRENIIYFNQQKNLLSLKPLFVRSKSAIQSAIVPGNDKVKVVAKTIQENGFNVKAILSPTVPKGQERLRICLHSYDSKNDIDNLLQIILNTL